VQKENSKLAFKGGDGGMFNKGFLKSHAIELTIKREDWWDMQGRKCMG
jgi:hypothetical protein